MISNRLSKIFTSNFRNIESQIIDFSLNINCIFGQNGNGKTNLLEAIYFLIHHKSFRKNTSFIQLLSVDSDKPEMIFSSLFLDENNNKNTYTGKLTPHEQEWFLNGEVKGKKLETRCVFIGSSDSYLFFNEPQFRRVWFDEAISLIDKEYKINLSRYEKFLRQRNSLLNKKTEDYLKQIKAIDYEMSKVGFLLWERRQTFVVELNKSITSTFKNIFSEDNHLEINISCKTSYKSAQDLYNILQQNIVKDEILGHTSGGIHRDNYLPLLDGFSSFDFSSLGQQKMSFLSLVFAYIELFRYKLGFYPIVLIDDVSGELDRVRWARLIEYLGKQKFQVFITTANESFQKELEALTKAKKIYIQAGEIKEEIQAKSDWQIGHLS